VLAFAYSFSWVFAAIALLVRDPETAQVAGFLPIFPLVFASSAFVPTASMPHWLQPFAEHQPISVTVNSTRALTQAGHTGTLALTSLAWSLGILLVAAPLAISRYRRLT
jgi:ABC-type multidrug transport system permease subunit